MSTRAIIAALFALSAPASVSYAAKVSTFGGATNPGSIFDEGRKDLANYYKSSGNTVNTLAQDFSAANLAGQQLVAFMYPNMLEAQQIDALSAYVQGGGRLLIQSEGNYFSEGVTSANAILSGIGSSIVNETTEYDVGEWSTAAIEADPFTAGVTKLGYGYSSSLSGGTALARGRSNQTFISYEKLGLGYVFMIADTNTATDLPKGAFSNHTFYDNLLNVGAGPGTEPPAVPEVATWAMMVAGFGGMGAMMRRRRTSIAFA